MAPEIVQILSLGKLIAFKALLMELIPQDGGSVRGISAVHILKRLFKYINSELASLDAQVGQQSVEAAPADVFDFIVGTSTGGKSRFKTPSEVPKLTYWEA
jgi:hypothetical protein